MSKASRVFISFLAMGGALLSACGRDDSKSPAPSDAPVVHTDIATVERFVSLPGIVAVRWIAESPAPSNARDLVPGRTDLSMTAYVELDPSVWPNLDKTLGAPGKVSSVRIDESWAERMLTPHTLEQIPREGDSRVAAVVDYDIGPILKGTKLANTAQRVGSGLLMSFPIP